MALSEQPGNPQPDGEPSAQVDESAAPSIPARQLIDEAQKHFALKEYPSSIEKYADALESLREEHDEQADVLAPILHRYGRALLENFILNSAALGGGGGGGGGSAPPPLPVPKASGSSSKAPVNDPRFSFSGDAEDDDDDQDDQPAPEDDEDDLQVAFAVLDLARVIYERILSSSTDSSSSSPSPNLVTLQDETWTKPRIKAELAEVMNDLGDVGLESEDFEQCSQDYRKSLDILAPLLNDHSRRLADAHLRLGLALEFHPDVEQRQGAKEHVQAASDVLGRRIAAIEARIKTSTSSENATEATKQESQPAQTANANGKGKDTVEAEKDDLLDMSPEKLELELKDTTEIKQELDTKLEEYDTDLGAAKLNGEPDLASVLGASSAASGANPTTTKEALQQALRDAFLGATEEGSSGGANAFGGSSASASAASGPVNDLSSMVKRKKKSAAEEQEQEQVAESASKKARVEDAS